MINNIQYDSILVPIDGSSKSIEAFNYALKFSTLFRNCAVTLCYVINEDNLKQISSHQDVTNEDLEKRFRELGQKYFNKAIQ